MRYFILHGRVAEPVDMLTWAKWSHSNPDATRVALSQVGLFRVSTVFLGLDHSFGRSGTPLIFETMIFGEPFDNYFWRCGTYDEAEVIHEGVVADLRAGRVPVE